MRTSTQLIIVSLILLGNCLFNTIVVAGESRVTTGTDLISDIGEPVCSNVLDSLSGGQSMQIDIRDMVINNMNVQSDLTDNILYSATTGANILSHDAFSSASGISTVIQNTGNQVVINSALILNLQLQ